MCASHTKSVFEPKVTFHFEILESFRGFRCGRKVFNKLPASRADAYTHMTKVSISMALIYGTPKICLTSTLIVVAAEAYGHVDGRFELWQLILINVWEMKT